MNSAVKPQITTPSGVIYQPNFLKVGENTAIELYSDMPWEDRTEARRECFFSMRDEPYTYGTGEHQRTYTPIPEDHPTAVRSFIDWVRARVTLKLQDLLPVSNRPAFEACFVNGYANKKHALGWHADDSNSINHEHPIVVISLGSWRELWWREKAPGNDSLIFTQRLDNSSMFVMPAGMQQTHEHRIPKADAERGPRISLTFRSLK